MKPTFAILWIKAAKRHFSETKRYRWWALYAALLTGFMHATWLIPFNLERYFASVEHRWLWWLDASSWWAGISLCGFMAIVGLIRSGWAGRALSLYALWFVQFNLGPFWSDKVARVWNDLVWYAFGLPGSWIESITRGNLTAATCLWCVYLAAILFAIRPLTRRVWTEVLEFEHALVKQWPSLRRFARSIT